MEVEAVELTMEDILYLHQGWIRDLIVDGKKTDLEIVELLHERRLHITILQLHQCLLHWGVRSLQSSSQPRSPQSSLSLGDSIQGQTPREDPEEHIETRSVSDGWELVEGDIHTCSTSHFSSDSNTRVFPDSPIITPSTIITDLAEPEATRLYSDRPLPSLPTTSKNKRKSSMSLERPPKDKLKLTCYHGHESHAVEMTLGIFDQGPSPIERYVSDEERYERIAIGLPKFTLRKAGEWRGIGGKGRRMKRPIVRKKNKAEKEETEEKVR